MAAGMVEVNGDVINAALAKLDAFPELSLAGPLNKALQPFRNTWNEWLPPGHELGLEHLKGSIDAKTKKLKGEKGVVFGIVGANRNLSSHARVSHLVEKGHKTIQGRRRLLDSERSTMFAQASVGTSRLSEMRAKYKGLRANFVFKRRKRSDVPKPGGKDWVPGGFYGEGARRATESKITGILLEETDNMIPKALGG